MKIGIRCSFAFTLVLLLSASRSPATFDIDSPTLNEEFFHTSNIFCDGNVDMGENCRVKIRKGGDSTEDTIHADSGPITVEENDTDWEHNFTGPGAGGPWATGTDFYCCLYEAGGMKRDARQFKITN